MAGRKTISTGVGVSRGVAERAKRKLAREDRIAKAGKRYRSRSVEPKGSTVSTTTTSRTNTRKENKFQALSREFDGLKKSAQRAEVAKGSDSKYYSVIQARKPKRQRANLSEVEIDTSSFGDVDKAGRLYKGGQEKDAKPMPKSKPKPPQDMGAVARGNRMSKMEAGSKKAMGRKAGGYMKKKGYKAGTGKGTVAKPRGVGCAMRGYGKAMKG